MGTGVCEKCRLIVQWRFKYDKYKPLRMPGNCQSCRKKTVTKAYRIFCDACARDKHVCAGCSGDLNAVATGEIVPPDGAMEVTPSVAPTPEGSVTDSSNSTKRKLEQVETRTLDHRKIAAVEETDMQVDDISVNNDADQVPSISARDAVSDWDSRKFSTIASTKYSKNRVVGSQADTVFVFGQAIDGSTASAQEESTFPASSS
jgi:hypothetical protein